MIRQPNHDIDDHYMGKAIEQAKLCPDPKKFGSVIVYFGDEADGVIVAETYSTQTTDDDITRHAELAAVSVASRTLKRDIGKLMQCTLYSTCEPCLMCWGAIFWGKIGRIVYGMEPSQSPHNFCHSDIVYRRYRLPLNGSGLPNPEVKGGVRARECLGLMPTLYK